RLAQELLEAGPALLPLACHCRRVQRAEDVGVRVRMAAAHVPRLAQPPDARSIEEAGRAAAARDDEEVAAPAALFERRRGSERAAPAVIERQDRADAGRVEVQCVDACDAGAARGDRVQVRLELRA